MNDDVSGALQRTRTWLASSPDTAASLAGVDDPLAFAPALRAALQRHGRADDADTLAALDFAAPAPPAAPVAPWPAGERRGWQPVALEWGTPGGELVWCAGDAPEGAPFHEQTVARLRHRTFNRWFAVRTPLSAAFVADLEANALPLAGLLYHLSRCGSTLVGQALKAWPGTRVIGEPGVLDIALTMALSGMDPHGLAFRGTLAALAQPAASGARVLLKLDAWHALAIGWLRARLPQVPWAFVYRDPLEVLVSHARAPGRHTVPGMLPDAWLGPPDASAASPIDHAARVLGAICAAIVPHTHADRLVNYAELVDPSSDALTTRIPRLFGLDPAAVDRDRFAAALRAHAKRPDEAFVDDRGAKQRDANDAVRNAARRIAPHYAALESIRLGTAFPHDTSNP